MSTRLQVRLPDIGFYKTSSEKNSIYYRRKTLYRGYQYQTNRTSNDRPFCLVRSRFDQSFLDPPGWGRRWFFRGVFFFDRQTDPSPGRCRRPTVVFFT